MPIFRATFLSCLLLTIAACSHPEVATTGPKETTGVCFRHLQWWDGDTIRGRSEAFVVKSSSNLAADMRRLEAMEAVSAKMPDLVPNVWHHGWLGDGEVDLTRGPSCAGLPAHPNGR